MLAVIKTSKIDCSANYWTLKNVEESLQGKGKIDFIYGYPK
jgi:hypothetical protein